MKYKSTRTAFGETLLWLAEDGVDIAVVSADTFQSMKIDILKSRYPERCFDVGISEQNMMMVAAGLSSTGKTVFASTYSVFASLRALEQIRTFIAYPGLNVKIVAGLGGFSAGIEGVTHIAMEDMGVIRSIPNMCLINCADAAETEAAVRQAALYSGPVYIRIGRDDSPIYFSNDHKFEIGKANILEDNGNDLSLITTGFAVGETLKAAQELLKIGIKTRILEIHTLKPLDRKAIIREARLCGRIVTVEEHNIIGGLFSAVSEVLSAEFPVPIAPVACPDKFTESGAPNELSAIYGLTCRHIVEKAEKIVRRANKSCAL